MARCTVCGKTTHDCPYCGSGGSLTDDAALTERIAALEATIAKLAEPLPTGHTWKSRCYKMADEHRREMEGRQHLLEQVLSERDRARREKAASVERAKALEDMAKAAKAGMDTCKKDSIALLRRMFLEDWVSGGRSRIKRIDAEEGASHFDIYTQSRQQREYGLAMRFRVQAQEVDASAVLPAGKGEKDAEQG